VTCKATAELTCFNARHNIRHFR